MQNTFGIIINLIAMGLNLAQAIDESNANRASTLFMLTEFLRYASDAAAIELLLAKLAFFEGDNELLESRASTNCRKALGITSIVQLMSTGIGFFGSRNATTGTVGISGTIAQGVAGLVSGFSYLGWKSA